MKAILLAAGKGNRLKGVTKYIPKPMIEFLGKPVLRHNVELCKRFGITDLYINIHHLGRQIENYFGDGSRFGVNITYSRENKLFGTSGAVRKIADELWGGIENVKEPFYVVYGDNYTNLNLKSLKAKSDATGAIATVAFHHREDVSHSGVAEFDKNGKIIKYIEKPAPGLTDSHWVNAAVYYLRPEIFNYIPDGFSDFADLVFPTLLDKNIPIYGIRFKIELKAFDTPEMYANSMNHSQNNGF